MKFMGLMRVEFVDEYMIYQSIHFSIDLPTYLSFNDVACYIKLFSFFKKKTVSEPIVAFLDSLFVKEKMDVASSWRLEVATPI